jgi:hypothetical protein
MVNAAFVSDVQQRGAAYELLANTDFDGTSS